MMGTLYRRTYRLVSGEEVEETSWASEPVSVSLGRERVFCVNGTDGAKYMIPFFSVWLIKTEVVEGDEREGE